MKKLQVLFTRNLATAKHNASDLSQSPNNHVVKYRDTDGMTPNSSSRVSVAFGDDKWPFVTGRSFEPFPFRVSLMEASLLPVALNITRRIF